MTERENALRIINFDNPERVTGGMLCREITYQGCNHEPYVGEGHERPVGSKWTDIWGTEWHKEHAGVMGFPRGNPLADPAALEGGISTDLIMRGPPEAIADEVRSAIALLGKDGGYFCDFDQRLPFPPAHMEALAEARDRYGRYPVVG